jgi:hypothetical protein
MEIDLFRDQCWSCFDNDLQIECIKFIECQYAIFHRVLPNGKFNWVHPPNLVNLLLNFHCYWLRFQTFHLCERLFVKMTVFIKVMN